MARSDVTVADDDIDSSDNELDTAHDQLEPLDLTSEERKLITQPYDLGVKGISDDIERGRLNLGVEYQRKYVWDLGKASRLIESLLLNVPIPVCYFAEDEDGNYEVIDGLQRLTTINRYLDDEFGLSGISVLKELDGRKFSELAARDQRRLENRTIRCIVITEESHPDIKFDVFERLNTGAASLTAQELRNCVYRGQLNDDLKSLALKSYFVQTLGPNARNPRMDHEELLLRFFAIYDGLTSYRPPIRQFLNLYMRKNRKQSPSPAQLEVFEATCNAINSTFDEPPFRGLVEGDKPSRFTNKALFDSIMIPVAFCDKVQLVAKRVEVQKLRERLLREEDFVTAIGRATADKQRMYRRINMFADGLGELGVSVDLPDLEA